MNDNNQISSFELMYIIVNDKMGSKILHKAKKCGANGGTVVLAKGTVSNSLMNFFSLYDQRKEIVIIGTTKENAKHTLDELNKKFKFEKPNHGIAFTVSAFEIYGSRVEKKIEAFQDRKESESMYQLIMTIVNRGNAEEVIEAAKSAGSKGGTIINARGSGINETTKLFNMEIEPEKEMVMILSKEDATDVIVKSIRERLEIDKPGNGIIFIQNVNQTYGIYE